MKIKSKNINLFFFLFATILLVGCSNNKSTKHNVDNSNNTEPITHTSGSSPQQGGVDGGGGNYVGAEPKQVRAIFEGDNGFNLKETIKDTFKTIEFQVTNKFVDAEIESIFSRMLGSDFLGDEFDIYQDIDKSPYKLKPEGPCLEDILGGFTDASTEMNKKGSPICFSLERLTELPVQAIPFQLVALAVHEHAHHYGFSEEDAVKAQEQILKILNQGLVNSIYMDAVGTAGGIRDHSSKLLERMDDEYVDKLVCKHLAEMNSEATKLIELSDEIEHQFELRMLITAFDYEFGLTKKSLDGVDELRKLTRGTLPFCGNDPLVDAIWSERVNEGDRKALRARLMKIKLISNKLVQQAIAATEQRKP
jgi:hypothetical protein